MANTISNANSALAQIEGRIRKGTNDINALSRKPPSEIELGDFKKMVERITLHSVQ